MFLVVILGIVLGGFVVFLVIFYIVLDIVFVSLDDLWRGFFIIVGSWIGGGVNQMVMKEIFDVDDNLFVFMIVVDVVVVNIWMGFFFYGVSISK